MRRARRLSDRSSWVGLETPADESADRPARANDAEIIDQNLLMRAVKATASWAMRETIFGFAIYGASYYPCPSAWGLLAGEPDAVEAPEISSLAGDASPEFTMPPGDPPLRLVIAAPPKSALVRSQGGGWRTRFKSRLARLCSFLPGSARAGDHPAGTLSALRNIAFILEEMGVHPQSSQGIDMRIVGQYVAKRLGQLCTDGAAAHLRSK